MEGSLYIYIYTVYIYTHIYIWVCVSIYILTYNTGVMGLFSKRLVLKEMAMCGSVFEVYFCSGAAFKPHISHQADKNHVSSLKARQKRNVCRLHLRWVISKRLEGALKRQRSFFTLVFLFVFCLF